MIDDPPSHSCQKLLPPDLQSHMPVVYTCAHAHMHALTTYTHYHGRLVNLLTNPKTISLFHLCQWLLRLQPLNLTCRPADLVIDTHIYTHTLPITPTETFTSRQQVWICKELETNEWTDRWIRRGAGREVGNEECRTDTGQ